MMTETHLDYLMDKMKTDIQPVQEMLTDYRCACMEIETKFKVLNERFSMQYDGNPIESIKTRVKSPESIIKKMERKDIPLSIDNIRKNCLDVAGVRVICSFQEDIYMLAGCLLKQSDIYLIQKKDYIRHPKESGYRSLHLIVEVPIFLENGSKKVPVEVQLRTISMDFWASLEHKLRYKKNIDPDKQEALAKELYDCANINAELDARMQNVRNDLK